MNGRTFLAGVMAGLWLFSSHLSSVLADDAPPRPNFLFIYTDDQRFDQMSCIQQEMGDKARFPWFKTPNMDRLAREGARFRNAFVINSLCAPWRPGVVTGQY